MGWSYRLFLATGLFSLSVMVSTPLFGQSEQSAFRIDTDIYEDISKPPVMRSLTLFDKGICYDFDNTNTKFVTVIDPKNQRIILLNPEKEIKAELRMSELEQRLADATGQLNPEQKKAMAQSNGIERDPATQEIIVQNKALEYRCTIQKVEKSDIAGLYCQFADWSARLNAIYPPYWPAYLRLELNGAVAAENAVPQELQKISRSNGKERRLTAKLLTNWRLSNEDQKLILRAQGMMVKFQAVNVEQFTNKK